jgi:hypothetical protein
MLYRCEECGSVFNDPDMESWYEARPVGKEYMSEDHCPICGSVDIEEGYTRCSKEEDCTMECKVDCNGCELEFVPYRWLGVSYPLESSC